MKKYKSGLISSIGLFIRPSRMELNRSLQKAADELKHLNVSTEADFLSLGKRLQDYYLQTKNIATDSSSVAAMISGNKINDIMEGLKEITNWVKQFDQKSDHGVNTLTSTSNRVEDMKNQLDYFFKVIRNLHILCNFIKIETTRIKANEEFSALANDINKLADNIESKSNQLLTHNNSLKLIIKESLTQINDYKIRQENQSRIILHATMKNLNSLAKQHKFSADTIEMLSEKWKNISQSIGEVVASIQFHDITRQQIEHVIEVLNNLVQQNGKRNGLKKLPEIIHKFLPGSKDDSSDKSSWRHQKTASIIVAVCKLQIAQINNAGDQLYSAVTRIIDSLKYISEQTGQMLTEAGNLSGTKEQTKGSFLSEINKDLLGLGKSLAEYSGLNRQMELTMRQVADTVGEMSLFVSEIEKIGIDMKIVALNTMIHAAHIGKDGLSLSVLAEYIHHLSVETTANIKIIVENLNAFIAISGCLAQNKQAEAEDKWKNKNYIAGYMQSLIDPIRQSDENISMLLSRIDCSGKAFLSEVEKTIKTINIHNQAAQRIESVNSNLTLLVDNLSRFIPKADHNGHNKELMELTQMYTMSSEREIHESAASSSAVKAEANTLTDESSENMKIIPDETEAHFGDNVELF